MDHQRLSTHSRGLNFCIVICWGKNTCCAQVYFLLQCLEGYSIKYRLMASWQIAMMVTIFERKKKKFMLLPLLNAEGSTPRHCQRHLIPSTVVRVPPSCGTVTKLSVQGWLVEEWPNFPNHSFISPDKKTTLCSRPTTSRSAQGDRDTTQSCSQGTLWPMDSSSAC